MTLFSKFRVLGFAPLPAPPGLFALPLRLIVGYGFLEHGYAKLARGPDDFIGILHAIGMPFAFFLGWATILIEMIGGLLILFGAFVPLASAPMIVVLMVAIVTVHLPNGFSSIKLIAYDASGAHFGPPGYETDLLYVAALLALCFGGAGPFSLDGYVSTRRTVNRSMEAERAAMRGRMGGRELPRSLDRAHVRT
jgi:putative oxidoreductase